MDQRLIANNFKFITAGFSLCYTKARVTQGICQVLNDLMTLHFWITSSALNAWPHWLVGIIMAPEAHRVTKCVYFSWRQCSLNFYFYFGKLILLSVNIFYQKKFRVLVITSLLVIILVPHIVDYLVRLPIWNSLKLLGSATSDKHPQTYPKL